MAIISHKIFYGIVSSKIWYYSILLIRVNKVPVLSKDIILHFFIFYSTPLFLIKIPFLIAIFSIIATTLGTANPSAHGHEATKTPIPLSITQQKLQPGTCT